MTVTFQGATARPTGYGVAMSETVKVLVIEPTSQCRVIDVTPNAPQLQQLVGGWIENIGRDHDWIAYGNEEGRIIGLPPNLLAAAFLTHHYGPGIKTVEPVGTVVVVGLEWVGGEDGYGDADVPSRILESPMIAGTRIDLGEEGAQ